MTVEEEGAVVEKAVEEGEVEGESGGEELEPEGALERLLLVFRGRSDPRLRATWRVLLAAPLVLLTGVIAQGVVANTSQEGMLPTGLAQAGSFALLLFVWARFVDRRRLENYGFSLSSEWVADLVVAFVAVVVAHVAWYALGSALGWTTVEVAGTPPEGSLAVGLGAAFVAIAVNVWVQDTVYFGLALKNAAEGFRSHRLALTRAVVGGWLVGVVFFVWIHGVTDPRRILGLVVAGALFGALYVLSGELALPIGFHLGVNYAGGWLFPGASVASERPVVFTVTESLPVLGILSDPRIPQMVVAFLMVVAWLKWRRGGVGVETEIAQWKGRDGNAGEQ